MNKNECKLINEFKHIDITYLNINELNEHSKIFYDFLNLNSTFISKIFDTIKIHNLKKKTFKNYIKYLKSFLNENIKYENMKIITSDEMYACMLISIAIA
jgi:hypothetical protein